MTEGHDLEREELYQESLWAFQEGRWEEAITGFESLLRKYPDDEELKQFLEEARKKKRLAEMDHIAVPGWRQKLMPLVMTVVALVVLFGMGYWIVSAYQTKVAPKRETMAAQQRARSYVAAGTKALAAGDFDAAEEDFRRALSIDPNLEKAKEGLREAQKGKEARDLYDRATEEMDDGRLDEALRIFRELQQRYPGYENVSRQIAQIESQMEVEKLRKEADAAYAAGKWAEAARLYTQLLQSDPGARDREIEGKLYTAYLRQGETLIKGAPSGAETLQQAEKMFRQALRWKPRDPVALAYLDRIERYREGNAALQAGNPDAAIPILRGIYMEDPEFLGGTVVEDLYSAYLTLGERYEKAHDYTLAYQQYLSASMLPVKDTSEAKRRMLMLGLFLTPTPTPSPTPTPTPTPSPTPTPGPLNWYKGYIAFLSDRDGSTGLYIMPPSGRWAIRVSDDYMKEYEQMREQERYAPGKKARVYAEGVGEKKAVQLFIWRYDIPQTWGPRRQLTDSPAADYDPVWSPTGEWIAFVSERTGNDEIWIIHPDRSDLRQLTHNSWEWDKHPSWSPDGKKIVFWSNRKTGRRQIWVMKWDGTDQHDISNDKWNDWDPIWIK